MSESGYYRHPTLHHDTLVFVCEDDLWMVPASGGIARRLTSNPGQASLPALSPDGAQLAFVGRDEGHAEVYRMPALGGGATRLTYLGAQSRVVGWTADGARIVFASNASRPFGGDYHLYTIAPEGGEPERLPVGPAHSIAFGPAGGRVLGRHTTDIARWKRYRGGMTGDLWIDAEGRGDWRRLIDLAGNVALPLWVGARIYFLSDHEGIGNLYSCTPAGDGLRRHTHHEDYYARHAATDGRRIVYQAGADLYIFDPAAERSERVEIAVYSPRADCKRRFVSAARYLQGYDVHPAGHALAITARGRPFSFALWEGAVTQHGAPDGVRHRLTAWLCDGKRLVTVSDAAGEEALEVHPAQALDPGADIVRLDDLDIGRPTDLAASPTGDQVALANQRHELILVDLEAKTARVLDRSRFEPVHGLAWSPDGRWLAYGFSDTARSSIIKLARVADGATFAATRAVLRDVRPAWDPAMRYLYFLSYRAFDPVYDNLHFDLGFPRGMRPYLVTLQADLPSPFIPTPRPPGGDNRTGGGGHDDDGYGDDGRDVDGGDDDGEDVGDDGADGGGQSARGANGGTPGARKSGDPAGDDGGKRDGSSGDPPEPVRIDLDGITERIVAFPVPDGQYGQIAGVEGKVLYTIFPVEGALEEPDDEEDAGARGILEVYSFDEQDCEELVVGITDFALSMDARTLVYRAGERLRAVKAGDKPPKDGPPGRKSGWLGLGRVRISVSPPAEWAQMYREAWRLQRDRFWTPDMSGVDWQRIYQRYLPLLGRIATRSEFSDLMWEMQGELGTSHAYEFGGDYPPEPAYVQGFLGADLAYDAESNGYVVEAIIQGDVWDEEAGSPLARPGANVEVGDRLIAIGGRRLGKDVPPGALLVNQAESEVDLTFVLADEAESGGVDSGGAALGNESTVGERADASTDPTSDVDAEPGAEHERDDAEPPRTITVKTLASEMPARYRAWVEANRARVHAATEGRVGYLHIPDMGARGYAEFHRGYLTELDRDGLIVDVRFNAGGHVSQLILEKLARRRLGYDVHRWGEPIPYPVEAVAGPVVALTNEHAGSDGDMFCHAFKMLGLGPLVGRRTWGGVVGIAVRDSLVDGGITSQPEYSMWFRDIGWGLENYGTAPDIEVEIAPQDHAAGRDPQLERAIAEALRLLAEHPPLRPEFGERPRRDLPVLPKGQ